MDKVNDLLGPGVAQAVDGGSVRVSAPMDPSQRVDYLSILENLEIDPGQAVAKVIINSRTGTIVIGQNVKVSPAAVTHGSLTVTITEDPIVSQPGPSPMARLPWCHARGSMPSRKPSRCSSSAQAPRWMKSSAR